MTEPLAIADLVAYIKRHAHEHYADGGWDVIVECWSDGQIEVVLTECGATTEEAALALFAFMVDVWTDRQADAHHSSGGYEPLPGSLVESTTPPAPDQDGPVTAYDEHGKLRPGADPEQAWTEYLTANPHLPE